MKEFLAIVLGTMMLSGGCFWMARITERIEASESVKPVTWQIGATGDGTQVHVIATGRACIYTSHRNSYGTAVTVVPKNQLGGACQ